MSERKISMSGGALRSPAGRADMSGQRRAIKEKRSFRINGSNEQCSVGPAGRRKERRKFVILPSIPPSVRPSVKG